MDAKQLLVLGDARERRSDAGKNLRYSPRRSSFADQSKARPTSVPAMNQRISVKALLSQICSPHLRFPSIAL
jgi:hypothetical protein